MDDSVSAWSTYIDLVVTHVTVCGASSTSVKPPQIADSIFPSVWYMMVASTKAQS